MATMLPQGNIDWEVPEYQNALKLVIKYEIQTLLERLSQTGEETVVLTANTTDLCVGHLASEKGKKFLNTNEVGEMKNKFLYYCTVEGGNDESGITVSVLPQNKPSPPARGRGRRGQTRGAAAGRGKRGRSKAEPVVVPNQPVAVGQGHGDVGQRLAMPQHIALSDSQTMKQYPNTKAKQCVKTGEKRQQSFTAEEIQDMIVSAESKRRKIDTEKHTQSPMKQVFNRLDKGKGTLQNIDKLPQNKQHVLLSEAESSDFYDNQAHHDHGSSQELDIKTPRFTQENLEFQKFLQQYNEEVNKKYGVGDSEYEDEEYDEDMEGYEMMGNKLEKGEISQSSHFEDRASLGSDHNFPSTSQATAGPSQFQRQFQNFQKNNQVFQNPQTVKGQGQTKIKDPVQATQGSSEFEPKIEIKEELETEGYGDNIPTTSAITDKDSKSGQNKPQISLQSIINNATKKLPDHNQKPQADSNEAVPEIKEESDPHDLEYKQSADSSTSGLKQQADSSNQHVDKSPNQPDLPDSTQQTRGPRVASPRPVSSNERTKKEDFSAADVSAKLEMLSAKMSWVVEYPKNFNPSEQQQQQLKGKQQLGPQPQSVNFPQEEEEEYPEGYEVNEEEYDDEEEELDEEDLQRLAAMKQYRSSQQQFPNSQRQFPAGQGQFIGPQHPGHSSGMGEHFEEFDEEDYDEEAMEHLDEDEEDFDDEEYGELDSEDEQTLREMGHLPPHGTHFGRMQLGNIKLPPPGGTNQQNFMNKGQISQNVDNEYGAFQNVTTSDTENFLMMGAMAKCLVCNKLIRKNDILQHNMMHIQEDEDEEEEEDIEGIHDEVDDMDGEMHGMTEMHGDMDEIHEDVDEMNEEGGEMQDLPEEMQEMHENMLEPSQEEMREDGMGAEPHGEMHGEAEIQDDGDYDAVEGGESHDSDRTDEKVATEELPPNTCEICFKTFKNKYGLVKHVKTHGPKDLECDLCDKSFRLESYLTKHRKKMHPNAPSIPPSQRKDMTERVSSGMGNEITGQQQLEQHVDSK